jgi:protein-disulfide isomerase
VSKKNQQLRAERAAAALREQESRERRRRILMILGTAAAVVLLVVAGFLVNRARDTTDEVNAEPAGAGQHGLVIGTEDAPHDIVIYEDFLCPYCGELEAHSHEELAQLADDGKVRVEYRPFVILDRAGDYSQRSTAAFAVVLDKSGPEVAKRFHDLLFANQPSETGPFPDDGQLVDLAVQAGAEESAVADGIENGAGNTWADDATQAASDARVRSTPTVLLDGQVFQEGRTPEQNAQKLLEAVAGG